MSGASNGGTQHQFAPLVPRAALHKKSICRICGKKITEHKRVFRKGKHGL